MNNNIKQFQTIPGVGPSIAQDIYNLGYRSLDDLIGQDPQFMYNKHCEQRGLKVDRCILYVFRCAVYFASNDTHEPELLKWWNWKDKKV